LGDAWGKSSRKIYGKLKSLHTIVREFCTRNVLLPMQPSLRRVKDKTNIYEKKNMSTELIFLSYPRTKNKQPLKGLWGDEDTGNSKTAIGETGKLIAFNRDGNFRWNISTLSSRFNRVRYWNRSESFSWFTSPSTNVHNKYKYKLTTSTYNYYSLDNIGLKLKQTVVFTPVTNTYVSKKKKVNFQSF